MHKTKIDANRFRKVVAAAKSGSWLERVVTMMDEDLNPVDIVPLGAPAWIVVDDAYNVTVLHIARNGVISEVEERE